MSSGTSTGLFGGLRRWLDAMPHPALACEIALDRVALASGTIGSDGFAFEALPPGAVVPSPVELNIVAPDAVSGALARLRDRIAARSGTIALLVPDQAVRVFLLHFDSFPRDPDEAIPLLRWRLKKSVPFDVEETSVSYMIQRARGEGVDVLAGIARQRIIKQYEELLIQAGYAPGVVLGSTLAVLPLLDGERPTLLARLTGMTLTTVIVSGELLCVYRCAEMAAGADRLDPQALLDEVYPAAAYFQDTWQQNVRQVRLAGFGPRVEEFGRTLEGGLGCAVGPLIASSALGDVLSGASKVMVDRQFDALVGWMMNKGA